MQEKVTGALNIYATTPDAFDDDAVAIAQTFAGFAAVGLANAHLYETQATLAVPQRGASMADENDQYAQAIHASIASTPDGTVPLPLEAVQAGLMQGEPPDLQQLVFALAVPQPGGYRSRPSTSRR